MWEKNAIQNFDLIAFAVRHHGRDKIAGAVIAESGRLVPGRAVVGAGDMGKMVFEMVLAKPEARRIDIQRIGQERMKIAHRLLALSKANEIRKLSGIG